MDTPNGLYLRSAVSSRLGSIQGSIQGSESNSRQGSVSNSRRGSSAGGIRRTATILERERETDDVFAPLLGAREVGGGADRRTQTSFTLSLAAERLGRL